MSDNKINDREKGETKHRRSAMEILSHRQLERGDYRQLARTYRKTMEKIANVIHRDITDRFDLNDHHPDVSALFYKGAMTQLSKAAINSIGERKARSILRQVNEELRSR